MTVSRMEQLARDIVAAGLSSPDELKGCTREEIEELQRKFRITLPETYVEWLRIMGRDAGKFLKGSDAFFPALLELREGAEELLAENGTKFAIPHDAFVFLMHQGYQFLFFRTAQNDPDPQVSHYLEGKGLTQPWNHLSDYFQQALLDYLRIAAEMAKFK
jgi:SMI1 / KNR4 family (SUKH-1)